MSSSIIQGQRKQLFCERLPLAIYREVVAHLRQVDGVKAGLLEQTKTEFDYLQSQVGGLWLEYSPLEIREEQIRAILNYYERKYGSWQSLAS